MTEPAGRQPGQTPPTVSFGAVSVFFGEKNGKYPEANQVIVQGRDTRVALDAPLVANRMGEAFDACDMRLYAVAARVRLARLVGGDEGAGLSAAAEGFFRAQEVKNPPALLQVLAPGW